MGTCGWSYKAWNGNFYPVNAKNIDYLKFYSRTFNSVEADTTFYALPKENAVKMWFDSVPENFLFCLKMPRVITHEKLLYNVGDDLNSFMSLAALFKQKLGIILIQLAPGMKYNYNILSDFINILPVNKRYAMEFRHSSWFNPEIYSLLREHKIAMVWSILNYIEAPPVLTADFLYVRIVGDHSLSEKDFGSIKINRDEIINRYAKNILKNKDSVKSVFIFSNNHFQGMAPATINILRKFMNMEELKINAFPVQKKLF